MKRFTESLMYRGTLVTVLFTIFFSELRFRSVIFNQTATYFPLNSTCWNMKKDQPLIKYGQTLASYWVVKSRAVAKYLALNIQIAWECCPSFWRRDVYYQTSCGWACVSVCTKYFLAPISGSPGDQIFSLTFRNSTSIFLNSHLWSKTSILKLNNT